MIFNKLFLKSIEGLFIGISVLSMAEFFELIIKIILVIQKHRKTKKAMVEASILNDSPKLLFNNSVLPVESLSPEVIENSSSRIPSQAVNIPDPVQLQLMKGYTEFIKMD